jgi:hypothetical protein
MFDVVPDRYPRIAHLTTSIKRPCGFDRRAQEILPTTCAKKISSYFHSEFRCERGGPRNVRDGTTCHV